MVRIPVRPLILSLLFALPAMAQSSWLHPSDREYQYAIDGVSEQTEVRRDNTQPLEFIKRLTDGSDSYISVRPPLACANLQAQEQIQEFRLAPTVDKVKKACDGQLLVTVRHFLAPLGLNRSLLIEHGNQKIKPSRSFYDRAHPIIAVDDSIASEQFRYASVDLHFVIPDSAWDDDVVFVTDNVNGEQTSLTFNFSSQVENEQQFNFSSR